MTPGAEGRGSPATGAGRHARRTRAQLWRGEKRDFTALDFACVRPKQSRDRGSIQQRVADRQSRLTPAPRRSFLFGDAASISQRLRRAFQKGRYAPFREAPSGGAGNKIETRAAPWQQSPSTGSTSTSGLNFRNCELLHTLSRPIPLWLICAQTRPTNLGVFGQVELSAFPKHNS